MCITRLCVSANSFDNHEKGHGTAKKQIEEGDSSSEMGNVDQGRQEAKEEGGGGGGYGRHSQAVGFDRHR